MPMTVVVTNNAAMRVRGFLASCMLEVAPGVYTNPRMSTAVRERVWNVLWQWTPLNGETSVIMLWQDGREPSGQGLLVIGSPPRELVDQDGVILSRRRCDSPTEEEDGVTS